MARKLVSVRFVEISDSSFTLFLPSLHNSKADVVFNSLISSLCVFQKRSRMNVTFRKNEQNKASQFQRPHWAPSLPLPPLSSPVSRTFKSTHKQISDRLHGGLLCVLLLFPLKERRCIQGRCSKCRDCEVQECWRNKMKIAKLLNPISRKMNVLPKQNLRQSILKWKSLVFICSILIYLLGCFLLYLSRCVLVSFFSYLFK